LPYEKGKMNCVKDCKNGNSSFKNATGMLEAGIQEEGD